MQNQTLDWILVLLWHAFVVASILMVVSLLK